MNAFKSLSKRERSIAISVIVLVGLFVIYQFLLQPYLDQRDSVAADRALVTGQLADTNRLIERQRGLEKVWDQIKAGGLKSSRSPADSQAQQAVIDWATAAGVHIASLKSERDQTQGQYLIISFHVTGTGSMLSISNLLWSIETATIPVRASDLQISPRKENTDDLTLQMTVSTLCLLPDTAGKTPVSINDGRSVMP